MVVLVTSDDYLAEERLKNVQIRFNNYKDAVPIAVKHGILPCSFYDLAGLADKYLQKIKDKKKRIVTSNTVISTPKGTFITTKEENPLVKYADLNGTPGASVITYDRYPCCIEKFEVSEWAAKEIENMAEEDRNKSPSERRIFQISPQIPENIEKLLGACPEELRNYLNKEYTITTWEIEDYKNDSLVQFLFKDRISEFPRLRNSILPGKTSRRSRNYADIIKFSFRNPRKEALCDRVLKPLVYDDGTIGPLAQYFSSKRYLNMMPIGVI